MYSNNIGTLDQLPNELVSEVLDFTYKGSFNHFSYIYSTVPSFQRFLRFDSQLVILTNCVQFLNKDQRLSCILNNHTGTKNSNLVIDLHSANMDSTFNIDQHRHASFIFVIYNTETLEKEFQQEKIATSSCYTNSFRCRDESDIITLKPQWEKSMSDIVSELHYLNVHYEAVLIGEEFQFDSDLISKSLCQKRSKRLCDGVRYIQKNLDVTVLCDSWGRTSKQLVIN
ncbi:hypothetical protein WICPIJ_009317 [Wickerhamomyces pijperi]|uniref:Uncharacterized protein n=1 Tax=Wickerhamomyces pijperi TaxID=599730 RepID=A0A9P8PQ30_WICPI|nr:hypothetical protein WICPIJ_009317 [Wickerhamomyces pijperi]